MVNHINTDPMHITKETLMASFNVFFIRQMRHDAPWKRFCIFFLIIVHLIIGSKYYGSQKYLMKT